MADHPPKDKRRRQNRDSQRRFRKLHFFSEVIEKLMVVGERNKIRRFWSIASPTQVESPITSPAPWLSSSSSVSSEHTTSFIPSDDSSLLSPDSLPQLSNEWTDARGFPTTAHREDVLYRETQHYNRADSVPQMNLPPFALEELSVASTNRDTPYHQQRDIGPAGQAAGSNMDVVFSPISLLNTDLQINIEPSRPSRPEEVLRPCRRTSASRAEKMISDVENLYEFGVTLSIFPQDLSLRNALKKMKERFRSLVNIEVPFDQRDEVNNMYEGSSQESDSDK
jgi:hypothetical protein